MNPEALRKSIPLLPRAYERVLDYIADYWTKITCFTPKSTLFRIGLPHTYVAPNHLLFKKSLFYWDSYFIILGLVAARNVALAKDIVANLVYLFGRFGLVLARNRWYALGRTQPPFLTRMAFEIYEQDHNLDWLNQVMTIAKLEYHTVWSRGGRFVEKRALSRYHPMLAANYTAEFESGWDMTSRFRDRAAETLPIDLNCLLYQYETDFAEGARLNGNESEKSHWLKQAAERQSRIIELMWDNQDGFFYDFDLSRGAIKFKTLAAYYPLWCRLASPEQAQALVEKLPVFERDGGLANTERVNSRNRQWDWPNGWPNQQWIVIRGLLNYGFAVEAERIASKWLELNCSVFEKTGRLWEKYDAVSSAVGHDGLYPTQEGFGWTNAVFLKLLAEFNFNERESNHPC